MKASRTPPDRATITAGSAPPKSASGAGWSHGDRRLAGSHGYTR